MGEAFDPDTLAFYAAEAPVYTASGKSGEAKHLEAFLARLAPRAKILELGCGGGTDAEFMIARGFSVDATDGASEMAAKAEARLGHAVRVMRFDQLDALDVYDAVVASASLLHVPRAGLAGILTLIHRALKPGGWHVASYKGGGTEGRDRFGRYFNYLSCEQAEAIYKQSADWALIETEEAVGGGYDGKQGPWLKIVAQKAMV